MTEGKAPEIGSYAWLESLQKAAKDAAQNAVDRHAAAGLPVHFIDADGDICERRADGTERKVTKEEIEAFLTARHTP